jgi:prolycopene isomerase
MPAASPTPLPHTQSASASETSVFDVIVIGSGIGGLVTATQLAAKGAKVLVLERYIIPGGSSGYFEREGYRFDVGASMIFGFGTKGTTNLLTRALDAVKVSLETIPDPVQIHYHLPGGLDLKVHQDYEKFLQELITFFPHEREGIRKFYDECWKVFNCLNAMELLSLEEPGYLTRVFFQHPLACLGLVKYLPQNAGDIARRYIKDPQLLQFIDMECYCWSVVPADKTPMINAGMVFSDRHYGGINYPKGGVGQIAIKPEVRFSIKPGSRKLSQKRAEQVLSNWRMGQFTEANELFLMPHVGIPLIRY